MKPKLHLDVMITQEEDCWLAHCLQLDIVTTAKTLENVRTDIIGLIEAQISYAFEHDNLDNLFFQAPPEIWRKFTEPVKEIGYVEKEISIDIPLLEIQELCYGKAPAPAA
jgi:predicted RNase H-like HicB family nuclease